MKYSELGRLIKSEREKRGWEQSDLASRMSVTQQTVSRWEKGNSRPRYADLLKLVDLLSGDTYEWSAKAGYEFEEPDTSLTPYLPLQNLSEEKFEFFCRDLIKALKPGYEVHRYGSRGHKQYGIDLFARKSGSIYDYQCKRHKQFGPSDISKAIKNTTFKAKRHYLLLSRTATTQARNEILSHPNWTLWDREDISAEVRALPANDAVHLVDNYFLGKRKVFLGIDEPSPWLTREKFYLPFANKLKLFSHGWNLVGRKKELELLREFENDPNTQAIIVCGRGGIGKSRLLKAWSEETEKTSVVRFVSHGSDVGPKDLELLPSGHSYLAIDDAHDRTDVTLILDWVARTRSELKVVLISRPYGITNLKDELTKSGIVFDSERTITLNDLDVEDARRLAEEIIADPNIGGDIQHAQRIAEITKDCPLATVIGSRLVGEGKIKPDLLNNDQKFREKLLSRFRDVVAGEVGGSNAVEVRELLDFLVMVQPFNPVDPNFQEAAEKLLEKHFDKIIRDISTLEDAGVLLRRGNRLRVVPDLLADYIRSTAVYDEKNKKPTGFADRVFRILQSDLTTNLLVNISQLDWRISAEGVQSSILDEIWAFLKSRFSKAKIFERGGILETIKKVSYYQPNHVMGFIRLALEDPIDEVENPYEITFAKPTYRYVIEKIPPVLRYIAHNEDYLIESLDLLKQIAETDERPTNQYPDHPIRVLQELASVEPGKPLIYNELVADHALGWLRSPEQGNFSPFDVLDQLLQTEGHQLEQKGFQVIIKPYTVNPEAVAGLRERIINAAFWVIDKKPFPEAVRALKTLESALSYPLGTMRQGSINIDRTAWDTSILAVLYGLEKVVLNQNNDPFISAEIRRIVSWHANHGSKATKEAAGKVLAAIPTTLNYDLSRAILDSWGYTFERGDGELGRDEKAFVEWRKELAGRLFENYKKNLPDLIGILEERIGQLKNAPLLRNNDAGPFLGVLMEQSHEFTNLLGKYLLVKPSSPLVYWFGTVVSVMAQYDRNASLILANEALRKEEMVLTRSIAWSLGWGMYRLPIVPEEIGIIKKLACSTDAAVRISIVRATKRFPIEHKSVGLDILLSIDITDKKEIADEVLGEFEERHGSFKLENLSDGQIHQLLNNLVKCPSIADYHIGLFLSKISFTYPSLALKLLTDRVEYKENNEKLENYEPLPYSPRFGESLRFHETSQYEQILRTVRDWASVETGSWIRFNYGTDLFRLVSAGFDSVTLKVLEEWIMSADQQQLEIASAFLHEADNTFVWENTQFVIKILERAQKFGSTCYQHVCSSLYGSVIQGGKSGIPGQPFPEDVAQRDRSYILMTTLPLGSPAHRFFKMLYDGAKAEIDRSINRDLDFL
jgi:transcriptional regulator with XRE-family HTH domain